MPDAVVIGAGPAGLAAAIEITARGLSCAVLDRGRPPIDKACGEGLMPGGVAALAGLGVDVGAAGHPFFGIRYLDDRGRTTAEGSFPCGHGLGLRRTALHAALADRAADLGIDLRWGAGATGIEENGVRTGDGLVPARWIVGADGLHSHVRRWTGLDAGPGPHRRYGVRRHAAVAPWADVVEVHWADAVEAYVTPVGPAEVGIAFLCGQGDARFDALLERFPAIAERVRGAAWSSVTRGAGPFHQRTRGVTRGRVALIGDAAGYLDPITGEGLSLAFRSAPALADALVRGDLAAYARAHREVCSGYVRMTTMLLFLHRQPALRRLAFTALGQAPSIFSRLLAMNDGAPFIATRRVPA